MYKIYYGDKEISFSHNPDSNCDAVLFVSSREKTSIAKMLEKLENNNSICIKADDPKAAFNDFRSLFVNVEAAGGVVGNPAGEMLMILRNGRWDLPKGHLEQGETPLEGAMREVREETGLSHLEGKDMVASTFHFYNIEDKWILKHTRWYDMRNNGEEPVPQTEEGIAEVRWVPRETVSEYLPQCFPSVREVLKAVLKP